MATGRPNGRPATPALVEEKISEVPKAPEGLNHDGRRAWNSIFSPGAEYIDGKVDVFQIETYCYLYQETEDMRRQITLGKAGGGVDRVISMNKGQTLARHPYVQDIKDNRAMMNSILASFGFTPADRAKMNMEKAVANEALEAIRDLRQAAGRFGETQ